MIKFHADDYVDFLARNTATLDVADDISKQLQKFNLGDDCPLFDGVYEYSQISAGGSIGKFKP